MFFFENIFILKFFELFFFQVIASIWRKVFPKEVYFYNALSDSFIVDANVFFKHSKSCQQNFLEAE